MEINGNEEFQNQDDIVLDVDYKEPLAGTSSQKTGVIRPKLVVKLFT